MAITREVRVNLNFNIREAAEECERIAAAQNIDPAEALDQIEIGDYIEIGKDEVTRDKPLLARVIRPTLRKS